MNVLLPADNGNIVCFVLFDGLLPLTDLVSDPFSF